MFSKLEKRKLPQGWRWAQLGDVCEIIGGTTPSTLVPDYWGGDINWVTPSDLGKLESSEIQASSRKITRKALEETKLQILPVGTVVLSSRAPIGHLGIARIPFCTNQGCKSFIPSPEIETDYLYHSLKFYVPDFERLGSGATFKEISKTKLNKFEIPLPPLSEQKRVVADLSKKMAAVERARAANLERIEAIRALPAAFLREIFSFSDGELPQGWRWVLLSEICSFIRGVNFKKSAVSYIPVTGYLPILRAGNIGVKLNTKDDLIWIPRDRISKEQLLRIGDIVVCMSSGSPSVVGKTAPLQKEWAGSIGAFCGIIRTKDIQHSQYLSLWFRSPNYLKWRDMQARGANIQNLRASEFENISIPLPPLSEQKRIVADLNKKMAAVEKARDAAEAESEATHALPAAFLREAFSGAL